MKELLTQNSKIRLSSVRTFNFGIPAYRSTTGLITCPSAGRCKQGCYALAGGYTFKNVRPAFEERLAATRRPYFVKAMIAEIIATRAARIRIHDSGDFYSAEYLDRWIAVARALPSVQLYAYSKQVSMIKRAVLPDNFTVVFSFGGTEDHLIDVRQDRHARVFETLDDLERAGYVPAVDSDDAAADRAVRCVGLVYHGTKSINKTGWLKDVA